MSAAVGTLELRESTHGLAGVLVLHGNIRIEITATPWPNALRIFGGGLVRGELRRSLGSVLRRAGELWHGTYPYALTGGWVEDRQGMALRCVVSEAGR